MNYRTEDLQDMKQTLTVKFLTVAEMSKRYRRDSRTVYRYLKMLRDEGAEVVKMGHRPARYRCL